MKCSDRSKTRTILEAFFAVALFGHLAVAVATLPSESMGNGEGAVGGPPREAYFRVDPEFRCPAGSAGYEAPGYRQALILGRQKIKYDPCTHAEVPLTEQESRSLKWPRGYIFSPRFVAFENEVYEFGSLSRLPVEGSGLFAWCTSGRDFGSDVLLYWDSGSGVLRAGLYFADRVGDGTSPRWREVRYVRPFDIQARGQVFTHEAFTLTVDPAPDHPSRLWANVDGQDRHDSVRCFLNR